MDEKKVELSIIVPYYKSKNYIKRCVDSILKQNVESLQVILVNDGSKDGSSELIQKYYGADSRIRDIRIAHRGVSAARNAGLAEATGKYVMFVDSDDWIEDGIAKELIELQKKTGAELVTCELTRAEGTVRNFAGDKEKRTSDYEVLSQESYLKLFFRIGSNEWVHYPVAKLYLREKLPVPLYPEGIRIGEDVAGTYLAIRDLTTVVRLKKVGYFYYLNPASATSHFSSRDFDLLKAWDTVVSHTRERQPDHEYALLNRARTDFTLLLRMLTEIFSRERREKYGKEEQELRQHLRQNKKRLLNSQIVWSRKVIIFMMCNCYPVLSFLGNMYHAVHKLSGSKRGMMNRC